MFSSRRRRLYLLICLITKLMVIFACYRQFLPGDTSAVECEYMRWQHYWARQDPDGRPRNILGALKIAKELGTFPSIVILLQIYATLPVTTATSERSFSALKYSKNYLRSTMSDNRLNGLALFSLFKGTFRSTMILLSTTLPRAIVACSFQNS